jgi:hypothetical protein
MSNCRYKALLEMTGQPELNPVLVLLTTEIFDKLNGLVYGYPSALVYRILRISWMRSDRWWIGLAAKNHLLSPLFATADWPFTQTCLCKHVRARTVSTLVADAVLWLLYQVVILKLWWYRVTGLALGTARDETARRTYKELLAYLKHIRSEVSMAQFERTIKGMDDQTEVLIERRSDESRHLVIERRWKDFDH